MSTYNRLCEVYKSSMKISFNDSSKIVLVSDCHRGDESFVDDFSHNQNIYFSAIKYYYNNDFIYIELGDTDELWKNKNFNAISGAYNEIFRLLHKFYEEERLYMIFGNHDIEKRNPQYNKKYLQSYRNNQTDKYEPLFENIVVHEGLILNHFETENNLFLIHGHQGDLFADVFWWFSRFLVRYVWRRFELFGFKDPTSAAKNQAIKKKVEKKMISWITKNNQAVIAGHTHRPTWPAQEEQPYFNVGSCVHPHCITTIEITNSELTLVRWDIKTRDDRTFYVDREIIAVPRKITSFF